MYSYSLDTRGRREKGLQVMPQKNISHTQSHATNTTTNDRTEDHLPHVAVPCEPTCFDFESPIIKTMNLLVETRSGT